MSDPALSRLLDRAVHHAPPMHLDGEHLLAAGKGRVRRRRVFGAGGGLAAAALAVAVWGGLAGSEGLLTGDVHIQPATTVWEAGERVDATLFTGYQTIDGSQVAHSFDGRLTRPDLAGPVVLELSDHGEVVEQIPAHSPLAGVEVFAGERMTVAVWAEPDGVVSAVPLVGPVDPGGPSSRNPVELDGERYGYSVWPADVTGVVRPQEVLDLYLVGEDEVVAISGAEVETAELHVGNERMLAFADASRRIWGYAVDGQDAVLEQLGDRPAHFSTYNIVTKGESGVVVVVLPEGAEDVGTDGDGASDPGIATLHDRPVVLVAAPAPPVAVQFTLAGTRHDLDSYAQDLVTLDSPGGRALSLRPDEEDPRAVALHEQSAGGKVFGAGQEELGRGWVVGAVDDGVVVLAEGWNPGATVLTHSRVEVTENGRSRWVTPSDVAQVPLADGTLVTALAVDVADPAAVTGLGAATGEDDSIVRWDRWEPLLTSADGVDWREVEGQVVPFVDGEPLEDLGIASLGEARLFAHPDALGGGVDLLVLPPGWDTEDHVLPLLRKGDSLDPAPWVVGDSRTVETSAGPVVVVEMTSGMVAEGTLLAVRPAAAVEHGADVVWTLMGYDRYGHQVIEGDLVQASGSAPGDPWLMYPVGDDSWGPTSTSVAVRAGLVGLTLLELVDESDPDILRVAAVLPEGSGGELVLAPGARLIASETRVGPLEGLELITAVVDVADTGTVIAPTDAVGLDLDGDGVADLRLPARG